MRQNEAFFAPNRVDGREGLRGWTYCVLGVKICGREGAAAVALDRKENSHRK